MEKSAMESIISKKIVEGLDKEEQLLLDEWFAKSEENRKTYESYTKLWSKSKNLVLSDSIDVEASLMKTKKRMNIQKPKRWLVYMRQVAAVLLVALGLNYLFSLTQKDENEITEQIVYQEIRASYGTQTNVTLADGTHVWLNSGSSLRFPTSFKNSYQRKVELNGEAYFDVTENKSKPFIVATSKLDVKVYGTSFNVSAYDSYQRMTVALTEGKVSVINDLGEEEQELMIMKPNDVVRYSEWNGNLNCKNEDYIEKYTAWKDGQIIFYGDPIDEVVRRLEKWYNVDIVVADKELRKYRFTATFIDESLDQVLKLLSLSSGMEYTITPARKMADNSFSQRKITLKVKR